MGFGEIVQAIVEYGIYPVLMAAILWIILAAQKRQDQAAAKQEERLTILIESGVKFALKEAKKHNEAEEAENRRVNTYIRTQLDAVVTENGASRAFCVAYHNGGTSLNARNFSKCSIVAESVDNQSDGMCPTVSCKFQTSGKTIISRLSYSHIYEIMKVSDPLARYFYEQECIKCTWSVRELRRQISTNLYVRAGISSNPEKMLSLPSIQGHDSIDLQIRQPFTFEFLGLKAQDVVDEHDLEDALISHLQEFILELGKGFCFESRQKRIIIDDEYYYPDLVFYNRILHCGVIIELKNEEFSYENFGQLNAYVSHYRENEMHPGDNPPIGILLCTRKGKKMVEYALAGMDNQLFVSTYMLQLPDKKTLEDFLLKQLREQEG